MLCIALLMENHYLHSRASVSSTCDELSNLLKSLHNAYADKRTLRFVVRICVHAGAQA